MINLFLATTRKRKFKLWLLTIFDFYFSLKIIFDIFLSLFTNITSYERSSTG